MRIRKKKENVQPNVDVCQAFKKSDCWGRELFTYLSRVKYFLILSAWV